MKTLLCSFALVLASTPAFAASEGTCDKLIQAFEKAGKAIGKPPDAEFKSFFKKSCLKDSEKDDAIKKVTACVDAAKTDAELNKCMK